MATQLRILTSAPSNFVAYAQGVLDGADSAAKSRTSLTYTDADTGRKLVIQGTGFTFQSSGPQFIPSDAQVMPTGGTVTSITIAHGHTKIADLSGFSETLPNVVAILGGSVQNFLNVIQSLHGPITFHGNAGRDALPGTFGDDTYDGGPGGDRFAGDNGSDLVTYASAKSGVHASLLAPHSNTGDAAGDQYSSIENLTGSSFNDRLAGNGQDNVLDGGRRNDNLHGGAGNDELRGGVGHDVIYGDAGNDTLVGGAGSDLLVGGVGADIFVYENIGQGMDNVANFDSADSVGLIGIGPRGRLDFIASANPHATSDNRTLLYDTNDKILSFDVDGTGDHKALALFHITGAGSVQESDIRLLI